MIEDYVKEQTNYSILRKNFCDFLLGNNICMDNELLNTNNRDYKKIAALGFDTEFNSLVKSQFEKGVEWLMGRNYPAEDIILYDNVALLGLIIGIRKLGKSTKYDQWIDKILVQKNKLSDPKQVTYSHFFDLLYKEKTELIGSNLLEIELSIFLYNLGDDFSLENEYISEYFIKTRRKTFPFYDDDDIFRNIIANYNVEKILSIYILDKKELDKKIYFAEEKTKLNIKKVLDKDAHVWAKKIMWLITIIIFSIFVFGSINIWFGDWNYYEPKTFIVFGTPFISYIVCMVYYSITNRELKLSPKNLKLSFENKKKNSLYKKFDMVDEQILLP